MLTSSTANGGSHVNCNVVASSSCNKRKLRGIYVGAIKHTQTHAF